NSQFEFFIHEGDNVPLEYNSEPDFCRPDFGGNFNVVYYVSAVSGYDQDSSGHVTSGESCYATAQGTPVMWMQNPVVDAGTENDTCGLVLPLNGSDVPSGMIGYWSSSCNFTAIQGTNYHDNDMVVMINTDDYGDCTFTWHIANGPCVGEDNVVMHFNQNPIPYAGNDTIVCGNQVELNVEHSIPGTTLEWSGSASFDPASGATTTVTVGSPGNYEFTLTEYNGSCYAQDNILVTFIPGPQPTIQTQVDSVCGLTYNLSVQNVNGDGQWTAFEDGTQVYPSFENEDNTVPNTEVTISNWDGTFRTIEFVWTETNTYQGVECSNDVSCEITFAKPVYAFAGANDEPETCGNEYTFSADTTGFGQHAFGTWIIPDGFIGYFTPDNHAPDATFTLTSMGSFGGNAQLTIPCYWVVSNHVCSDIDTIDLTLYKKPDAFAGNNDSVCGLNYQLGAVYDLPEGSPDYTADGHWNPWPDNPGISSFDDADSDTTMVHVNSPGVYAFIWRENNSFFTSCNDRDTVWIEFKANPVIDAGDDFDVCGIETNLNAVTDGFTGNWLPVGGANFDDVTDPGSFVEYHNGYGPVEFVWQESNDECTSQDAVTVTFWQQPTAELAMDPEDTAVCGRQYHLRAENPGTGVNGNWIVEPSNGVVFLNQEYDDIVEVTYYGYYVFHWTESNHPENEPPTFCSDTSEPWTVHFIETPQANAGIDTLFCGLDGDLIAEFSVATSTGEWSDFSSNISFENDTVPNTIVYSEVYT
ncbi:MAG: hypothetical protein U9Q98_08255, partial [Bacteroidota bacterium]|nr:hypothetical protein [Bacteroidota bacterium]